ncbi:hypothetical protein D3C80_1189860 [compost metagenome]
MPCAGFPGLLPQAYRLHDQRHVLVRGNQRQQKRRHHDQRGAQCHPADMLAAQQRWYRLRRCSRRFGKQHMRQRRAQHCQQHAFGQRFDHRQRQGEVAGAGGGDHGQADHQQVGQQAVAALKGVAQGEKNAYAHQQHPAQRCVAQQRNQQQPAATGEQYQHRQGRRRSQGQWLAAHGQQQHGEHRCQDRHRQANAKTHRQAQRHTPGQAQGAQAAQFNRHRTTSSSAT